MAQSPSYWYWHHFKTRSSMELVPDTTRKFLPQASFSNKICVEHTFSWHSTNSSVSCSDFNKIHDGIGSNLSILIQWGATFLAALAVGFYRNWLMTIALLVAMPLVVVPSSIFNKVIKCVTSVVSVGCQCSDSCSISIYSFACFSYDSFIA